MAVFQLYFYSFNFVFYFWWSQSGKPPPALVWYKEEHMIDDTFTKSIDNKTIRNDLLIINLTRNDLNIKYSCHAVNPNFSVPIKTSVSLDINCKSFLRFFFHKKSLFLNQKDYSFMSLKPLELCINWKTLITIPSFLCPHKKKITVKPLDISINSLENPLSAGNSVELICTTAGSRPPAQITWFKDSRPLSHSRYASLLNVFLMNLI